MSPLDTAVGVILLVLLGIGLLLGREGRRPPSRPRPNPYPYPWRSS